MAARRTKGHEPEGPERAHRIQLNRAERIALLAVVVGGVLFDLFGLFTSSEVDLLESVMSVSTTLIFMLYLVAPPVVATSLLGVAVAASFLANNATSALLVAAIAATLVLRLGSVPVIFGYLGGFLIANALFLYGIGRESQESGPGNVALVLIIATVAGGIGYALRTTHVRGDRLEKELLERAEREREAVIAERQWIAGELHDSIAHHLTVVAMHVQLLDDEAARPGSQEAIRMAARKALNDLRFVIQLAEDGPRGEGATSGDLAAAIEEASEEFTAAGHQVDCSGDPNDENIPRGAEIILARIMRESSTNILKYAGRGTVSIELDCTPTHVTLSISSPLPYAPRKEVPSSGTGLNRMAERVLGVSGEFSAGINGAMWTVTTRLPMRQGTLDASPTETQQSHH